MKIKLVADSSANIKTLDNALYSTSSMRIVVGEKEFVDDENVDVAAMQEALREYKGKTSSACPGVGEWMDSFEDADEVFGVTITSKLSGSYNAAVIAAQQYMEENPGKKVYIQDSLSAGPEMQLILEKFAELTAGEHDFDEVCKQIADYKQNTSRLAFCLSSVANLAKNGRVNPALAKVIGVLGIRIVGIADEGVLNPLHKCRGEKKALVQIFDTMTEMNYKGGKVRITHSDNFEAADSLRQNIMSVWPDADVQIGPNSALCSYYAEVGGLIIGYQGKYNTDNLNFEH